MVKFFDSYAKKKITKMT